MAQNRVVHRGSERPAPAHAQRIGAPDPAEHIELTVTVRRRKPLPAHTGLGAQFTRQQFAEQCGADPADLQTVADYAASHGFTVKSSDPVSRTVVVSGTIGNLATAFDAELSLYERRGLTFRARSGVLTVPAAWSGIVEGIFGFDQRPQACPHFRVRTPGGTFLPHAAVQSSFSPLDLASIYNFPQATGAGQTIGIIELGGGYKDSDLTTYFSGLGINPAPKVISVAVDGGSNQPAGDPNSADGEVLLDIEVAGAVAPAANIVVYFGPNTTQGFLDAITAAIHDTANSPSVISISWGGPEDSYTGQALQSYDQAFQDAKALGVTICVAAGDSGSTDGETDGNAHVDFPASSPNVLACGGTNLVASHAAYTSETVWNGGQSGGSTGGGVSETFPLPAYQSAAGVPVSVNASHFAGRGVPDVSADADPASGYNVLVDGQSFVIGGTSAVAPLWAALIARLNQTLGKNLGFLHTALYALDPSVFHDITKGNNGAYSAQPGWDACTGLGTPIGSAILKALQPPAQAPQPATPPAPVS